MAVNKPDRQTENEVRVPDLQQPAVRHEESDVNAWAIGKAGIVLALGCIAALAIVVGVFRYFQAQEKVQPVRVTAPNSDARNLPPEPRLQTTPILDLQQMRAAEEQILNGYGWVDQEKGVARVPIARAIDLLAERGLPSRESAPPPASNATVPAESGLGPIMTQPGGPLGGEPPVQAAAAPPPTGTGNSGR